MSYTFGGLTLANVGDIVTRTSVSTNFEKLASTSAAPSPGPLAAANPPTGQLWFDTTNSAVKVNTGTPAAPVWTALGGSVTVSATPPVSPTPKQGDLWYNSDSTVARGFVYYSGAWIDFSPAAGGGGGGASVTIADTPPTSPADGDIWYDSLTNYRAFVWSSVSAAWIDLSPGGGGGSTVPVSSAAQAQALTDDTTFISPLKLASALQGANQSLSASGYQKLPGGLIIQWGTLTVNTLSSATFTFPIAFPSSCLIASIADNMTPGSFTSTNPTTTSVQVTNANGAVHAYKIIAVGI